MDEDAIRGSIVAVALNLTFLRIFVKHFMCMISITLKPISYQLTPNHRTTSIALLLIGTTIACFTRAGRKAPLCDETATWC
jgi:hypothetical protein